jgi:sec-independent protein translocase protein TatB
MFDVGFPELVLVFVIALLVLGPQRLPKVAAELGKWVGRARRTATQLRRQLEREIELAEIQAPKPPPTSTHAAPGGGGSLSPSARAMSDALADSAAGRTPPPAAAPGSSDAATAEPPAAAPAPSDAAQSTPPAAAAGESHDKPPA